MEINKKLYDKDINDVKDWMNVKEVNDLNIEKKYLHFDLFNKQATEMESTYLEFPNDKERSLKILKELQSGKNPEPIYIEKNDPSLFIMEGRHRIVAFKWFNLKEIPVILVSKKNKNKLKIKP